MTSVPYPSFSPSYKVADRCSMAAVGRCRITMSADAGTDSDGKDTARQIYEKCKEQADCVNDPNLSKDEMKKFQKKYMKQSVAMAATYLSDDLKLDTSIIDVEVYLPNINDILDTSGNYISCLLDAGCAQIVIPYDPTDNHSSSGNTAATDGGTTATAATRADAYESYQGIVQLAGIPRDRLMVHITSQTNDSMAELLDTSFIERFKDDCHAISICVNDGTTKEDICKMLEISKTISDMNIVIQIRPTSNLLQDNSPDQFANMIGDILKSYTPKDKSGTTISFIDPASPELLGMSYAACIGTDRVDKLYSTVVCTRTNEALGLVYSSVSSIVAALQCGRGVYYSRSRNGLWRKGDTSGHYQILHRIDVDCDGDAIRFTVTQNSPTTATTTTTTATQSKTPAAFCHLETLTCWGPSRGIRHLEDTLQDRLHNATEGSYTQRLFQDTTLLRDKLVEEAQELAEADTPQHVAEELADVLYFSLVRAAQFGITLEDAIIELDRRSRKVTRRAGDSKIFRIEAANAILTNNNNNTDSSNKPAGENN